MDENPRHERKNAKRRDRGIFQRPANSGIWWIRYADANGKIHREKAGPKSLARQVYSKRKLQIREGKFFPETVRQREAILRQAIEDYLASVKGQLRGYPNLVRYAELWISALGDRTMRQTVPGDIERYVNERLKVVARATVNRELAFLKRVFNVAIRDGLDIRNPVSRIPMLKENNERVRFLSQEEQARLLSELRHPKHKLLVLFAVNTGLRQEEQFGLLWEHVGDGYVRIPRSKNGESRTVPLNEAARQCLHDIRKLIPEGGRCFPINAHNFYGRVFKPALSRAKIENLHWHDLRHTFASRLAMSGASLQTIKELLGHKSIAMTLRYAHLTPGHLREAVERLGSTGTDTGSVVSPEVREMTRQIVLSQQSTDLRVGGSNPSRRATSKPYAENSFTRF